MVKTTNLMIFIFYESLYNDSVSILPKKINLLENKKCYVKLPLFQNI